MYCVALDPGETTGVCLVRAHYQPWKLEFEQIGPKPHHLHLLHHLALWNPSTIVCESFDNRGNAAAMSISLEYIGVVKAYAQSRHCKLVMQSASTGKQFWTDGKLRKYGVHTPMRHARDACRHYLYYRTFTLKDQSLLKSID